MRTSLLKLFAAVLLACLAPTQFTIAADAPKEGNWESLFNGKDLTGWVPVHDVTFVVTNGNLRLVNGMGWLRTEKQYTDFVLEAEWRALVPAYDSGFFIRAGLEGKPWPNGRLAGQPRPQRPRWPRQRLQDRGARRDAADAAEPMGQVPHGSPRPEDHA